MRKIAGLNEDLYHRWVVTLSPFPEPPRPRSRNRADVYRHVLGFIYVDFDCGTSMWIEGGCEYAEDGHVVRRPTRKSLGRDVPTEPSVARWESIDLARMRPVSPEDCARLGLPPSPVALSGFNTPESAAETLADARLDPFRATGYPRDIRCEVVVDGRPVGEELWARVITSTDDGWLAAIVSAPKSDEIRARPGDVFGVSFTDRPVMRLSSEDADSDSGDDENDDENDADPSSALEDLAIAADERGDHDEAEALWRRVVEESERSPYALGNFATFLVRRERFDEAFPIFLEAVEKQRIAAAEEVEPRADDADDADDADGEEVEENGERWLLGAIELGFAGALAARDRYVEARELAAPWLADDAHAFDAREVWIRTQDSERQEARGDLSAIWSCILAMTRGPVRMEIQARYRAGHWEYRRSWPPMWDGAAWAADPPNTELRAVTPPLEGWSLHLANVLVRELLADLPAPDGTDMSHAAMLTRNTEAFGAAWKELTSMLGVRDHASIPRLLELLDAPVWDRVAFSGPAGRDEAAIAYEAMLRRARIGWAEELPLQDLDLAIGGTLAGARDLESEEARGAAIVDLVAALPTLRALQPWAVDLTRPPAEARVEFEAILRSTREVSAVSSDTRRVALVRDTRRWGISLEGEDPVWLPLGIGGEIWCRSRDPDASPDEIPEALVAHAEAARHDVNPRGPSTVFADADGELLMAWSMGRWWFQRVRVGSKGRRFKTPKTSAWSTDLEQVMFGGGTTARSPAAPPTYIHPMVAWTLWRAHVAARAPDPMGVDAVWRDMLTQARQGSVARRESDGDTQPRVERPSHARNTINEESDMTARAKRTTEPIHRVMEYTTPDGFIIGWAFLTPAEYAKWKRHPQSRTHIVSGRFYIITCSHVAEFGSMTCDRMWDYFHTTTIVPDHEHGLEDSEKAFVPTADHPARPT